MNQSKEDLSEKYEQFSEELVNKMMREFDTFNMNYYEETKDEKREIYTDFEDTPVPDFRLDESMYKGAMDRFSMDVKSSLKLCRANVNTHFSNETSSSRLQIENDYPSAFFPKPKQTYSFTNYTGRDRPEQVRGMFQKPQEALEKPLFSYTRENINIHNEVLPLTANYDMFQTYNKKTQIAVNEMPNEFSPNTKFYYDKNYEIPIKTKCALTTSITEEIHKSLKGTYFQVFKTLEYCKSIQKCIPSTSQQILIEIFTEIMGFIDVLLVDQYANYLMPILYTYLDLQSKIKFLNIMGKLNISTIAKNGQGTFSLQGIVGAAKHSDEMIIISNIFSANFLELSYDSKGVHVVMKIFKNFPSEYILNYYQVAVDNILSLAYDTNGLTVALFLVISVSNSNPLGVKIYCTLVTFSEFLVQHTYGNYIIQTAIELWGKSFAIKVFDQIKKNLRSFSKQKTASRVIEKCLQYGGDDVLSEFVNKISCSKTVGDIMKNKYGNYVLQVAVKVSEGKSKIQLLELLSKDVHQISNFGIRGKWENIIYKGLNPV